MILDLMTYFNKEEYNIDVLSDDSICSELNEEFKLKGMNVLIMPSRKKSVLKYIREYIKLLKNKHYDVVYVNGSSSIMGIELLIAKILKCNVRISHSHNTKCEHNIMNFLLKPIFYSSYTCAIACSVDAGKWLYGNREFVILKNGRNINQFQYNEEKRKIMRDKLGLSNECLAIGTVGNLNRQKNQEFLIRVFEEIKKDNPNAYLYLIGGGECEKYLKNLVVEKSLEDNVIFTGSINNVDEYIQAMDIMTLTSIYEGLPLVTIEWQLASIPCVLSDVITKECCFTDDVIFLSLKRSYKEWAQVILNIDISGRKTKSLITPELAKSSGFDIIESSMKLQEIIKQKLQNKRRINDE